MEVGSSPKKSLVVEALVARQLTGGDDDDLPPPLVVADHVHDPEVGKVGEVLQVLLLQPGLNFVCKCTDCQDSPTSLCPPSASRGCLARLLRPPPAKSRVWIRSFFARRFLLVFYYNSSIMSFTIKEATLARASSKSSSIVPSDIGD